MGKFDGYLICTDLDGTLYTKEKKISDENREAIEYFKREGGLFTFITGRMPYYSSDAYNNVKPNAPYGCVNGGALFDGVKQEYIWKTDMPKEVIELIGSVDVNVPDIGIQVCCFDKTYFSKESDTTEWFRKVTDIPKFVCDYRKVSEPIAKILFCTAKADAMENAERVLNSHPLADEFTFTRSSRTLYEILPKDVNKGLAFSKLIEHFGIDKNKTLAIGDYDNDVGMLKAAKVGVAVANASESAKWAADFITVSNEESAIARLIYDLEAGKYGI